MNNILCKTLFVHNLQQRLCTNFPSGFSDLGMQRFCIGFLHTRILERPAPRCDWLIVDPHVLCDQLKMWMLVYIIQQPIKVSYAKCGGRKKWTRMVTLSRAEAMNVVLPAACLEIEQRRRQALAACLGKYHPNIYVTISRMQVNNVFLAP